MRTDKKTVNLADTSAAYLASQKKQTKINNKNNVPTAQQNMTQQQMMKQQAQMQRQAQKQEKAYMKDSNVRSSPILGTLIGLLGLGGTVSTAVAGFPIIIPLIIGLAGGFGALICKGPYDFNSLSAKFCAGSSVLNFLVTAIVFAVYLKSIGLLDFVFNITI